MKKAKYLLIPIIALICCCALALAGCSSTTLTGISLSSNWYTGVTYPYIQDSIIEGNENYSDERLVYDVTYEPDETSGANYTLSYAEENGKIGTYETEFHALYIDCATSEIIADAYRAEYVEGKADGQNLFTTWNDGTITAYYYKTKLETGAVTYSYTDNKTGEESKATFDGDRVVTECYFLSCIDSLRPIYSKQDIKSHSPREYAASRLEDAYAAYDREYVTYYSADGSEATTELAVRQGDADYGAAASTVVSELDASTIFFDMSSLEIAARAMGNLDSTLSQTIELFIQSAAENLSGSKKSLLEYTLVGSDGNLGDCGKDVTALMEDAGMYDPSYMDDDEDGVIDTVEVEVVSTDNMNGLSQTYWYTAVEKGTDLRNVNIGRAALLKISSPLPYYLGDLVYTLSEIESTFKYA